MAGLTATAMNLLRQQERFTNLPPPDVLWQMPTPYEDQIERELLRLKSVAYLEMLRAPTGTVTVPTSISRHNKRLLLCQP